MIIRIEKLMTGIIKSVRLLRKISQLSGLLRPNPNLRRIAEVGISGE